MIAVVMVAQVRQETALRTERLLVSYCIRILEKDSSGSLLVVRLPRCQLALSLPTLLNGFRVKSGN
jgi:hypothetical protein